MTKWRPLPHSRATRSPRPTPIEVRPPRRWSTWSAFAVGRCSVPTDQGHRICSMAVKDMRDIRRGLLLIQSRTSEITPATRITRRRSPRARVVAGRISSLYRMAGTATRSPIEASPPTPGTVSRLDESYGRTETLLVLLRTHRAQNTTSHDRYSTPLIA